jgi:hypothetical protein
LAATRFVDELNQAIDRILEEQHLWPFSPQVTLMLKLPCFPFLVIYREAAESVLILAVAHGHRRPGYWRNRALPELCPGRTNDRLPARHRPISRKTNHLPDKT